MVRGKTGDRSGVDPSLEMVSKADKEVPVSGTSSRSVTAKTNREALNDAFPLLPPLSQRRKARDGGTPRRPSISDELDVLLIFQDRNIKFPETWTRGNDVRNNNRQRDTAMIRKRTRDEITRRDRRYPNVRDANEINAGRKTPIPPGPGKT